jgi:helicase
MENKNYTIEIPCKTKEPVLDVALDTINLNKQALIFVNSKRSAESVAEKIANKLKINENELKNYDEITEKILKVLSTPTTQCKRLAYCLKKGIAFHHSGLKSEQKRIIEQNFKQRKIKIICATPTLAQGVDLPAYRTIIRDLKRFTQHGMRYIPVLEYEQQSGRAGRPGQEKLGQAIVFAKDKKDKKSIIKKYINGEPEDIISKLSAEPILRTYVLTLISTQYCSTKKELEDFFSKTFFAFQYGDNKELKLIIDNVLIKLNEWKFIKIIGSQEKSDFVSATNYGKEKNTVIRPTILGKRISELYLDPYTANFIINYLSNEFKGVESLLFMFCNCIELKPLISVGVRTIEGTESWLAEFDEKFYDVSELMKEDYFELLKGVRTTMLFDDWINEKTEDFILEKFGVRPGELNAKVEILDWLIYSAIEISRLTNKEIIKELIRLRIQVKNGCKQELIPLLKFKNIGRIRARKLFNNNIKNVHDVKTISYETLSVIVGKTIALQMKKDVDIKVEDLQERLV